MEGDCPVLKADIIDPGALLFFSLKKKQQKNATIGVKPLSSFRIVKSTEITAKRIILVGSFEQFYPCLFRLENKKKL